jgi:hypothetical protein
MLMPPSAVSAEVIGSEVSFDQFTSSSALHFMKIGASF